MQYTPEQTAAMCFQILAQLHADISSANAAAKLTPGRLLDANGAPPDAPPPIVRNRRDPGEEQLLMRAEHLLFDATLSRQLGLTQLWPRLTQEQTFSSQGRLPPA